MPNQNRNLQRNQQPGEATERQRQQEQQDQANRRQQGENPSREKNTDRNR